MPPEVAVALELASESTEPSALMLIPALIAPDAAAAVAVTIPLFVTTSSPARDSVARSSWKFRPLPEICSSAAALRK